MSKPRIVFAVVLWMTSFPVLGRSQDYASKLDSVLLDMKTYLAVKKPDWKHRSIEPIKGSKNVSENNWAFDGWIIRISILAYASDSQAIDSLRNFAIKEKSAVRLSNFPDEGYSWGGNGKNACFSKREFTIWVSTVGIKDQGMEKEAELSYEFAQLVDAAIPAIQQPKRLQRTAR